jgi:hypothetical protein
MDSINAEAFSLYDEPCLEGVLRIFQVLKVKNIERVFTDMISHSLVDGDQHFGGNWCLHLLPSINHVSSNKNDYCIQHGGSDCLQEQYFALKFQQKKRSWTPQETMAMCGCRNRSSDLIHGGR